jgi:hypothetical protein
VRKNVSQSNRLKQRKVINKASKIRISRSKQTVIKFSRENVEKSEKSRKNLIFTVFNLIVMKN